MDITQHRLSGSGVSHVTSPNQGGTITPLRFLVMHFTAGRSAQSSVSWLSTPVSKASAHVVVARDGTITQLVPFNKVAWHAGISAWNGINGLNSCSIGIELDNMGELVRSGDRYVSWFKAVVPPEEVVSAAHPFDGVQGFWHDYTQVQMESAIELAALICNTYGIEEVLGHEDIAPGRKCDPGPAFPMRSFKSRVMGRQQDARTCYKVTADFLNIRTGPGAMFPKAAPPLLQGTRVLVEEQQSQWSRVTLESQPACQGWVSNAYIIFA